MTPAKRTKFNKMSENQMLRNVATFMAQTSALVSRTKLARQYGQSFGGDRDLYTALGYPTKLGYTDYRVKYDRQDIATRVVDAPVDAVWRKPPTVEESGSAPDEDTAFEKKWSEMEEGLHIYNYLSRVDKLAGIGRYAVLFMGFNDSGASQPWRPVTRASKLLYLRPYSEENADIKIWVDDKSDPRYGMPDQYELMASTTDRTGTQSFKVHHSRIFHVTEGMLEDDIYGTPRLQNVYNRLNDLELISGGAAEMFWRGAFPGYNFALADDAQWAVDQSLTDLQDEIEDYMHDLKRYIKTQGVKAETLATQVADPRGHAEVILELIAGGKGIPKRILVGSERGELASSQDETAWNNKTDERRKNFVGPWIIRGLIDKLIEYSILPQVESYDINWPDMHEVGEKDLMEINKIKMEILKAYAGTPGTDVILPIDQFLKDMLGYNKEDIEQLAKERVTLIEEEQKRIEEDQKVFEEEEARRREEELVPPSVEEEG